MTKAYFVGCIDPRAAKGHHNAIKGIGAAGHCYMHLRAGGAGNLGLPAKIMGEIGLAQPDVVVLTVHEDCAKCRNVHTRTRNLRINIFALRRRLRSKKIRVVGMLITHDGKHHQLNI